jgi:hypothetical protein
MSKLKSPQEKKRASLDHDCRNVFGENDKASRKLIPRQKQLQHRAERRATNQPLTKLPVTENEDQVAAIELKAKTRTSEVRRKGFARRPDARLRDVLAHKGERIYPPGK